MEMMGIGYLVGGPKRLPLKFHQESTSREKEELILALTQSQELLGLLFLELRLWKFLLIQGLGKNAI